MISSKIDEIKKAISSDVTLVAVSKTKPIEMIQQAMQRGHLDFGENKVQELVEKHQALPKDINWHMIGHLQRNKVKYIASFVHLIHGADSERLINEINKQAKKNNRKIDCLLQFHIAKESSKFGFNISEVEEILADNKLEVWENINIRGVMGMATFTENKSQVKEEFLQLKNYFDILSKKINTDSFNIISMGMSGDYKIAIDCGSNMVRIGSSIFGTR